MLDVTCLLKWDFLHIILVLTSRCETQIQWTSQVSRKMINKNETSLFYFINFVRIPRSSVRETLDAIFDFFRSKWNSWHLGLIMVLFIKQIVETWPTRKVPLPFQTSSKIVRRILPFTRSDNAPAGSPAHFAGWRNDDLENGKNKSLPRDSRNGRAPSGFEEKTFPSCFDRLCELTSFMALCLPVQSIAVSVSL